MTLNSGHIHRQTIANTPYETVDGEGILHQSENGNWGYGDIIISNDNVQYFDEDVTFSIAKN